jgi:hypothetical protein
MSGTRRLSEQRQRMAELVAAGKVTYDVPDWLIEGQVATGWDGRTLREMRRDGQIITSSEGGPVALSDQVKRLLDEANRPGQGPSGPSTDG